MTHPHAHAPSQPPALPFPGFRPTGAYAVNAQQEEIVRVRAERDAACDRASYYAACLSQLMDESNQRIAQLNEELSVVRNQVPPSSPPLSSEPGNLPDWPPLHPVPTGLDEDDQEVARRVEDIVSLDKPDPAVEDTETVQLDRVGHPIVEDPPLRVIDETS